MAARTSLVALSPDGHRRQKPTRADTMSLNVRQLNDRPKGNAVYLNTKHYFVSIKVSGNSVLSHLAACSGISFMLRVNVKNV